MLELVVFLLGSIGFIFLSRHTLLNQRSHGFPRFFAFEAILGLVVLTASSWFDQPFSVLQVFSWVLLAASAALVISAVHHLRHRGKPDETIQDPNRISFEKTTRLVTTGPYRFIRHPMYSSLLLFTWGAFLKQITLISALLVLLTMLGLFLTALYEERENLGYFGGVYAAYMKYTKRFIPFVF